MNENTVLLATFAKKRNLDEVVESILENFELAGNRVFVLTDIEKPYKVILTYNIVKADIIFSDIVRNTISLHRKKDTNTLFTLNALNEIVRDQNEGELDEKKEVDWKDYSNCILLTNKDDDSEKIKRINTKLFKIINL